MKKLFTLFLSILLAGEIGVAQNIGISTTTPGGKLQINHRNTGSSPALILHDSSAGTGSAIRFSKEGAGNTFSIISTNDGLAANSSLDIRTTLFSGIFLRGDRRIGINNITNPLAILHVGGGVKINDTLNVTGDVNFTGKLKLDGNPGSDKQVLVSKGANGNPAWESLSPATTGGSSVGFGPWGDCVTNGNISEYNPVADSSGADGDFFGGSVSFSDNLAIVGALTDDVGANADQGSVNFYQLNGSNWELLQKISDATGAANDEFGNSVAISGNFAIVGAHKDDVGANVNQGSASFYQWNGSSWILLQKITDATGVANAEFGISVAISGNYAIVGAALDDIGGNNSQGSASIYQWNGSNWILMQKITDAGGLTNDQFGNSVAISGNYAIIGAALDDVGANPNQGSTSIYQWNGSSWVLMQKVTDATGAANDNFGASVSISGNYAIVGAKLDDVGANLDQGSASIYQWNSSSWVLIQKSTDPNGLADDNFGASVSISGMYAIIGTALDDVGSNLNQGSASIYYRLGQGWYRFQYITDPATGGTDNFGSSVSVDGINKRFLIGAPGADQGPAFNIGKVIFGRIN